ncbi:S1 RNA-binding domain-containing protein [Streptomyces sp. R302]|uniref:S1 RNA-binding domain-containing protein n=1 Tax=unclassified Streptomyces TaxID=2593676 RepID=UPI00145E2325|nr:MULTISPECIES: S1 RNA-binding domain-containing protein [unclassified Streptomyces]NML51623.1 S1 RNA-binding domain-containing protein [Streptomyces sp. R301]NML81243.1 S1 RNA-binding domain-containing protein [Streptomyces sp. R302]
MAVTYPLPSAALKEFLATLRHGEERSGVVAAIENFGVFVDLDDAPEPSVGFIPPPEVSWKWFSSISEVLTVGQRVTAAVVGVDAETRGQAVLSLRALQPNPWLAWVDQVGSVRRARVTKLVPFGAFVSVADGIDGLLHNSELSKLGSDHSTQVGDELATLIVDVDPDGRRIRLSLPTERTASD